jgi:quercetin dioxygenase-like cupin family protein
MTRAVRLATFILLAVVAGAASAAEIHVVAPDTITWQAPPPGAPAGGLMAVLSGDPRREGLVVMRAKFPPGYVIRPHWHSTVENVTVISGELHMGFGDTFDKSKARAISAGGFIVLPPRTHHYGWSDVETVIQVSTMGPFDMNYVNPQDDPRTAASGTR